MPKFKIVEKCEYELEAATVEEAMQKFLNGEPGEGPTGGAYFQGVLDRDVFQDGEWVEEPELDI